METRIQFRISEEIKQLAQLYADRNGMTISDACRELTQDMAKKQLEFQSHDEWLNESIEKAYAKLDAGEMKFVSDESASALFKRKLNKIKKVSV